MRAEGGEGIKSKGMAYPQSEAGGWHIRWHGEIVVYF